MTCCSASPPSTTSCGACSVGRRRASTADVRSAGSVRARRRHGRAAGTRVTAFGWHHTSGRTYMTYVTRRTLLRGAAGTALGLAFAGPYRGFVAHAQRGFPRVAGYGDLVPVADENGGAIRLELPSGFKYRTFHPRGTAIPGDSSLPGRHDGMGAFPGPNGHTILVRNHEINGNRVSM